jgi:hypothetical protein
MTESERLTEAWMDTEAHLPEGWTLGGLRCASTGLDLTERSDDWIAVAVGPGQEERRARAGDPIEALGALVSSFARDESGAAR